MMNFTFDLQRFAHKKGVSSTRNGRDSESKRLGVKEQAGTIVTAGQAVKGVLICVLRRSGGIGRRSRLKICRRQLRAGSSPAFGTNIEINRRKIKEIPSNHGGDFFHVR